MREISGVKGTGLVAKKERKGRYLKIGRVVIVWQRCVTDSLPNSGMWVHCKLHKHTTCTRPLDLTTDRMTESGQPFIHVLFNILLELDYGNARYRTVL